MLPLLRASHPGPTVAVTGLTALLAVAAGHSLGRGLLVTCAVASGQLSIGWSNDLLDTARDTAVTRSDKPLASGAVTTTAVRRATGAALGCCVVLSLGCGWAAGLVHLLLGVGSGWAYNLGLKTTRWSAAPYAVAFGALPAVVSLALVPPRLPPLWLICAGALLGVGAHLLNALPDLADDALTGVHGLPQRLGARKVQVVAPLVLLVASVITVFGPPGHPPAWAWLMLLGCTALAMITVLARGRGPFLAAIGIAALDVVTLVIRS